MECAAAVPGPVVAGLVRLVEELLRGFEICLDPKELFRVPFPVMTSLF